MRRLWWRLLDRIRPRYSVGYDPAYKDDYGTAVLVQMERDGTLRVVSPWICTREGR